MGHYGKIPKGPWCLHARCQQHYNINYETMWLKSDIVASRLVAVTMSTAPKEQILLVTSYHNIFN